MRPERTLETVPFPAFPPSLAGRISFGTQPGTLSLANFQCRFATARTLKNSFARDKRRGTKFYNLEGTDELKWLLSAAGSDKPAQNYLDARASDSQSAIVWNVKFAN